jgi:hypothetical protein
VVLKELERWWEAAEGADDKDNDNLLSHEEYSVFYHRLVFAFNHDDDDTNDIDMESAFASQEADWAADSEGDGSVDKDDFFDCIFEFALTWADHVDHAAEEGDLDPYEITTYLTRLFDAIFKPAQNDVDSYWGAWIGKEVLIKSTRERGKVTDMLSSGLAHLLMQLDGSTRQVKLEELKESEAGGGALEGDDDTVQASAAESTHPWSTTGEHEEHSKNIRLKYAKRAPPQKQTHAEKITVTSHKVTHAHEAARKSKAGVNNTPRCTQHKQYTGSICKVYHTTVLIYCTHTTVLMLLYSFYSNQHCTHTTVLVLLYSTVLILLYSYFCTHTAVLTLLYSYYSTQHCTHTASPRSLTHTLINH